MVHPARITFFVAASLLLQSACLSQQATFTHIPTSTGQVINQVVKTRSQLQNMYEQSGQLISSSNKDERIHQERVVTVLESSDHATPTVSVTYAKASKKDSGGLFARSVPQPVLGKSYIVRRINDELVVTYPDEGTPPRDELGIVKVNMQSVGRPNPLASWLNGRTIAVGENLTLPQPVARQLLGEWLADSVLRVNLKLVKLHPFQNQEAATFDIDLGGQQSDGRQPISSSGQVTVGVSNCWTMQLKMQADVDLTEQRGPAGAQFTVANNGTIDITMRAEYAGAPRL